MVTAFMAANALHAIHIIHQQGMTKIGAKSYCNVDEIVGDGIFQVADWAFDGRANYGKVAVCPKCAQAITSLKVPPR